MYPCKDLQFDTVEPVPEALMRSLGSISHSGSPLLEHPTALSGATLAAFHRQTRYLQTT
jgi:hypothetical protein